MGESGWYPPGAENDPSAPWNQPDDCETCDGTQEVPDTTATVPTMMPCPDCVGREDDGPDVDAVLDAERENRADAAERALVAEEAIEDHLTKQRLEAADREAFHKAAIKQAGDFARRNPHLIDDFSDADPGL